MANNRRNSARAKDRVRKQRLNLLRYALIAAAVLLAVYFIQLKSDLKFGRDVFYSGTYVNGLSLEGLTYEQAEQKLAEQSADILNGTTFHLHYGDREWDLSTADLDARLDVGDILQQAWGYARSGSDRQRRAQIRALKSNPIVLASSLEYNEDLLREFVYDIQREIETPAVSAEVTVTGFEQFSISQSQNGISFDADALIDSMLEAMTTGGNFDIELELVEVEPEYTTQELINATQKLSGLGTDTSTSSSKRTSNVRTALNNFNGLCVQPGQQISFNEVVGERTLERGYTEAPEYAGTSLAYGIGGGTCQASSTVYCNVVYAGLQIDERYNHSMTVGYTKPSLDAAVNDTGTKDMKFTNNTAYPIYFFSRVDDSHAYVSVFGKPSEYQIEVVSEVLERDIKSSKVSYQKDKESKYVYYTDEQMLASTGKPGMRSQVWRYFKKDGEIVTEERLSIDYYEAQPDVYWIGTHQR